MHADSPPEKSKGDHGPTLTLLNSLSSVLNDLFSLNLSLESENKRRSIIAGALAKHFNLPSELVTKTMRCPLVHGEAIDSEPLPQPASPGAGAVCSGDDLADVLGVDGFELVQSTDSSDTDFIAPQSHLQKETWLTVSTGKGKKKTGISKQKSSQDCQALSSTVAGESRRSTRQRQRTSQLTQ
jgi:hypothetical protein